MTTLTRREQQQQALRREVLDTALLQLDEGGPSAVNWRALARAVGVSPSTLYTYFESIDALHTALILEVYEEMAAEVRGRVDPQTSARERIAAAASGYRRFATQYPARFTLVFTDVLPGYAAPEGGSTIDAQVAVMAPLIDGVASLLGRADTDVASWPAADRSQVIRAWAQLHGFISLEVNHHLVWLDDVDELFVSMIDELLADLSD
ncbi:MAG TPA: TetR/AcrR family transcriptional regulator [Ilumatobacteraceae bacterium]|nr:TetR/AcrR family transcriptional regulator [Ilumatobacteraceae bacterium]